MKTLEELYKEIQGNEELKKEFIAAFKEGRLEEFLKSQNSDATPADVVAFLKGTKEEILSEDDLAKVAGGCMSSYTCQTGKRRTEKGIYRCIQRRQAGGIPEKSEQRRGTGGRGGILKRNQRRDCIGR